MDNLDNTLGDRIVYRGRLPLEWRPAHAEPTAIELSSLNNENAKLLRVFRALDEAPGESGDNNTELQQAIIKLDAKLDLILGLMGEMLSRQNVLPPAHDFALSELGLVWVEKSDQTLPEAPGQPAYIDLFLKPDFPRPIKFFGHVGIKKRTTQGVQLAARFHGLSEEVRDELAKLIFRQHRRMIANRRGG